MIYVYNITLSAFPKASSFSKAAKTKICPYLLLPPRKVPSISAHTATNSQFAPRFCSSLCYNWIMFAMNSKMLFSVLF